MRSKLMSSGTRMNHSVAGMTLRETLISSGFSRTYKKQASMQFYELVRMCAPSGITGEYFAVNLPCDNYASEWPKTNYLFIYVLSTEDFPCGCTTYPG